MKKRTIMLSLVIGVVSIGMVVLSLGCEEDWLEDEVVPIVEEELARQLPAELEAMNEMTLTNLYIENEDGDVVAILGVDEDGSARLTFGNETNTAASLYIADNGGGLDFSNGNGTLVVRLSGGLEGGGTLQLFGADGNMTFQAP